MVIRFADSHGKTRRSSKSERNLAALPGGGMNGGSGHGMTGLGGSIGNGLVDIPTRMGGGSDSRDNSFRGGSQHHPGVVSPGSALISLIANNAADPRCPRAGVEEAVAAAAPAWAGHESNLRVLLDESIAPSPLPASEWAKGHVITAGMWREIDDFLRANLKGV